MDFGIKGSDCWESDAFQDKFIKDYFGTSSGKKTDSSPEGKKLKSKRKRSKSGGENNLAAEIDPQENSFAEMVAKPKKSKKKKSKSQIKSGSGIAEIDVQERSSVETVAKPKKRKREKIASDDVAKINKKEDLLTETVIRSKKKKRKKTKLVDKSDDISVTSPHEHSIAETVTKPKKNKRKKHEDGTIAATDMEGSLTTEAVVRSKKKKQKRSENDATAVIDVEGSSTTETIVRSKKKKKSENAAIAATDLQGFLTTETVIRSKKKKKDKSTSQSNAKIDTQEHSTSEMIAKPNKKRENHSFGVQLINGSLNSTREKTANSGSSLLHSLENPKFQTKNKKKTRRGKRVLKSKIETCEKVSSSTHLLKQENIKDKYLQNKLEYFKNKFQALKGKTQNDSSMTEKFSSVKKQNKAQLLSSVLGFSRLNNVKEKTHNDSSRTDDFSSVKKQKKAQLLSSLPRSVRSSALKEKAQKVLRAAKFRIVNEKLYSGSGKEAMNYFKVNKEAFKEYHEGYELQVSKWPVNPVDLVISHLQGIPNDHIIADLGCGNAKIATTFPLRTIYSYDLVPVNEHVTQCDISKVPLGNDAVDVAVFCLSLMGTNLNEYILEAHRILKTGGLLKIAEVESRMDDLNDFVKSIEAYGFQLSRKDISHKMFVLLDFNKVKVKLKKNKLPPIVLSPCLYKKR